MSNVDDKFRETLPPSKPEIRKGITDVFEKPFTEKIAILAGENRVNTLLVLLLQENLDQVKETDIPQKVRSELIKKCSENMKLLNVTSAEIKSPKNLPAQKRFIVGQFKRYAAILFFLKGENALEAVKYSLKSSKER